MAKPNTPTIYYNGSTSTPVVVPSSNGTITLTYSANGSSVIGAAIYRSNGSGYLQYYSCPEANSAGIVQGNSFTVPSGYYYKIKTLTTQSYDVGVSDYSNVIRITRNTAPMLSGAVDNTICCTVHGDSGNLGYRKGWADQARISATPNKTGTLYYQYRYFSRNPSDTNPIMPVSSSYYSSLFSINITSTSNEATTFSFNPLQVDTTTSNVAVWQIIFWLDDGIEESVRTIFPNTSDFYSLTPAQSIEKTFNQFDNSNVEDSEYEDIAYFYQKARIKLKEDTSLFNNPISSSDYNRVVATATIGTNTQTIGVAGITNDAQNHYTYIDLNLPSNSANGVEITIKVSITSKKGSTKTGANTTIKRAIAPTFSGTIRNLRGTGGDTLNPFNATGTTSASINNPFLYNNYQQCICSDPDTSVKLFFSNQKYSTINAYSISVGWELSSWETDPINTSNLYTFGSLSIPSYAGTYQRWVGIQITNVLGEEFYGCWTQFDLDFDRAPTISWGSSWCQYKQNDNYNDLGSNRVQEGLDLKFNFTLGVYTAAPIEVTIEAMQGSKIVETITTTFSNLNSATSATAVNNNCSIELSSIKQINSNDVYTWTATATLKSETTPSSSTEQNPNTNVVKQCEPLMNFSSCTAEDIVDNNVKKVKIDCMFETTDTGLDDNIGSITYDFYDGAAQFAPGVTLISSSSIETYYTTDTNWRVKKICVRAQSVVIAGNDVLLSRIKTYYSNYLVVYKVQPTVAYRPGQIGINTKTVGQYAVLDLYQADDTKSRIYLRGRDSSSASSSNIVRAFADLSTGQFAFNLYSSPSSNTFFDMRAPSSSTALWVLRAAPSSGVAGPVRVITNLEDGRLAINRNVFGSDNFLEFRPPSADFSHLKGYSSNSTLRIFSNLEDGKFGFNTSSLMTNYRTGASEYKNAFFQIKAANATDDLIVFEGTNGLFIIDPNHGTINYQTSSGTQMRSIWFNVGSTSSMLH